MNILEWYNEFLKLSQTNPAIAGFVGIWVAGITGWLLKDLPVRIKTFIVTECLTTLHIVERGDTWSSFDEKIQFNNFFSWVHKTNLKNLSRHFGINKNKEEWELSPGLGVNFFLFKSRLFWYTKIEIQGSGQSHYGVKYQVNISTYGRNIKVFEELFSEFKDFHTEESSELRIRQIDGGSDWWDIQKVPTKDIDKVFMNKNTYNDIMEVLEQFNEQLEVCKKLQTSHRLTILLEGPTGTGKTTIIKSLANHLQKNIYLMSPIDLLKSNLSKSFARWGTDGIIVVEDIDSLSSIKSRGDYVDIDEQFVLEESTSKSTKPGKLNKKAASNTFNMNDLFGGLSKVLNNLDGIVEYHGTIMIMTTNDVNSIDPAILRPGRIDRVIHVGWLSKETIIDNLIKFYHENLEIKYKLINEDTKRSILNNSITIDSISGAKLSNILKFAKDIDNAIEFINKG